MVLDDCMKNMVKDKFAMQTCKGFAYSKDHVFLENRIQKLNLKYNVKTSEVAKTIKNRFMIYISFGYLKQ
jgi:hypothetical protein